MPRTVIHYLARAYKNTDNVVKTACNRKVDPNHATPYKTHVTCSECNVALRHSGAGGSTRTVQNGKRVKRK